VSNPRRPWFEVYPKRVARCNIQNISGSSSIWYIYQVSSGSPRSNSIWKPFEKQSVKVVTNSYTSTLAATLWRQLCGHLPHLSLTSCGSKSFILNIFFISVSKPVKHTVIYITCVLHAIWRRRYEVLDSSRYLAQNRFKAAIFVTHFGF
jgi:hypothetical protein